MNIYDSYIKNYRDARTWESLLRDAKEDGKLDRPERKEHYDEIKRAIRRFYKKVCDKANSGETGFGEFDHFTRKYPLPEHIKSREDAVEYMEDEWVHCRPSQYDCTGQIFTTGYCVFQKSDGRWWAYHMMAMDV